jgi:hypothetical protein
MLQRSDWFALLLGVFVLGAGAYLSTYSGDVIRGVGIALMGVALWGLLIWFLWEKRPRLVGTILIIGGALFAILSVASFVGWFFLPPTKPTGIEQSSQPQRDSDTIYQRNIPVGFVIGANEILPQSIVTFDELYNVGKLDQGQPFDYKNHVLVIQKNDGLTLMGMSKNGTFTQDILPNVICKIIGNR